MNFSQIVGISRIVLPAALSFAVGKGWVTQDMSTQILSILAAVIGAGGWSAYSNSTLNLAKTVGSTQGLQVTADRSAPAELQAAAYDPNIKSIVSVSPAPNPYATSGSFRS